MASDLKVRSSRPFFTKRGEISRSRCSVCPRGHSHIWFLHLCKNFDKATRPIVTSGTQPLLHSSQRPVLAMQCGDTTSDLRDQATHSPTLTVVNDIPQQFVEVKPHQANIHKTHIDAIRGVSRGRISNVTLGRDPSIPRSDTSCILLCQELVRNLEKF